MSVPANILQGLVDKIRALPAERVAEIIDFVDFLHLRATSQSSTMLQTSVLDMPVISVKRWRGDLNLSREAMYSDDGR